MAQTGPGDRQLTLTDLAGAKARHRRERAMRGLFFAAAFLSVVISVAIVASLAGGAIDFLTRSTSARCGRTGWFPRRNVFDIKTIVAGTLIVSLIAMFVATPLGLGAALYLSEYASPRARRFLKPILETLASVPSVVMGFFALRVISPDLVQRFFGSDVPLFNFRRPGSPWDCSSHRWWRRSLRTRCTRCRARFARPRSGSAPGSARRASGS